MKKLLSPAAALLTGYASVVILFYSLLIAGSFLYGQTPYVKTGGEATFQNTARPSCCCEKLKEILAPATRTASTVKIDCNLTLRPTDVITKRMIFEGLSSSRITVNGNGAKLDGGREGSVNHNTDMIEVRSRSYLSGGVRKWERPVNIIIKNLTITGSVRIWGMAKNGQGSGSEYENTNYFKKSSKTANHVSTARSNAPRNIVFDHVTIIGVGRNPLYFGPGVSNCKLTNSEVKGKSDAVAIYLDAESYRNSIEGNYIHVATKNYPFESWDRPLIAIDGSSYNMIRNNRFAELSHGGIYLYRNCGEGGVIRHSRPAGNRIIGNVFYYDKYKGHNPAIYLGSRNYGFLQNTVGYCNDDEDFPVPLPYGSSKSDMDYATYNVIRQNRIHKRAVKDMIQNKNPSKNEHNIIDHNVTIK